MTILDAKTVYGEAVIFKEPRIVGGWILWLEQRPKEGGRTTALIRPWRQKNLTPQELTPYPINLKTKFHGYGGAPLTVTQKGSNIILTWIDDCDNCLWMQIWSDGSQHETSNSFKLKPKTESICLSKKDNYFLAGGVIDLEKNIWIGLMENEERDYIITYSLKKTNQNPKIVYSSNCFLGYLSLNSKENKLAWIEWQKTSMPWDANELNLAQINENGEIFKRLTFNSQYFKFNEKMSFFNPKWSEAGDLYVAEDRSGWWNITQIRTDTNNNVISIDKNKWVIKADLAFPQWVLGMSSFSCVGDDVVGAFVQEGSWSLAVFKANGSINLIDLPLNDFSCLHSYQNRLVSIASGPIISQGILEIDLNDQSWEHTPSFLFGLDRKQISIAESFWFNGTNQKKVHSWYYPPLDKEINPPPLLVKSHSGPTAMANCGLDMEVQFWTSRGWGVVDVNYGGSTGFGRQYRDRLKGNWGVVDVVDCTKAAEALIKSGKANKDLIAIMGSSASGFTALGCLAASDIFKIAACKYAVTDLISMANSTHRFEAFYLDYLIGNIDSNYDKYIQRSPSENVKEIKSPLILFHGLKDRVISFEQSIAIRDALLKNEIDVEINLFENEGHGFKDGKIKVDILNRTEAFFRKYLNI